MSSGFQSTDQFAESQLRLEIESLDSPHSIFPRYLRTLQRLEPYVQVSLGSSEPWLYIQSSIEDFVIERHLSAIRERLFSISIEAESLLRKSFDIVSNLEQALECLENFLANNVTYSIVCDFWQDPEAPFFRTLEVIVKVNVEDYNRVLELWKVADERIYAALTPEAKKKIVVLFERV